jgi:hypothetical protein
MERVVAKQVSFGRSCVERKVFFVTDDANLYTCPWCLKIDAKVRMDSIYELPERGFPHGLDFEEIEQ